MQQVGAYIVKKEWQPQSYVYRLQPYKLTGAGSEIAHAKFTRLAIDVKI
jgi:hypothetical protein